MKSEGDWKSSTESGSVRKSNWKEKLSANGWNLVISWMIFRGFEQMACFKGDRAPSFIGENSLAGRNLTWIRNLLWRHHTPPLIWTISSCLWFRTAATCLLTLLPLLTDLLCSVWLFCFSQCNHCERIVFLSAVNLYIFVLYWQMSQLLLIFFPTPVPGYEYDIPAI